MALLEKVSIGQWVFLIAVTVVLFLILQMASHGETLLITILSVQSAANFIILRQKHIMAVEAAGALQSESNF